MLKEIDDLQADIGINFYEMIPTEFRIAYVFYELGKGICPSFWFCYIDADGKVIPADGLERRKDIIVKDVDHFSKCEMRIIDDIDRLHKLYLSNFGKQWYGITYQLNPDGTFEVSFSYEKPSGSLQQRREKWCLEHLGTLPPKININMLRN